MKMKMTIKTMAALAAVALASMDAGAAGCLKGAAVGAVAGHVAGKHTVLGAAGGCLVGRHMAGKKEKEEAAARAGDGKRASTAAPAIPAAGGK